MTTAFSNHSFTPGPTGANPAPAPAPAPAPNRSQPPVSFSPPCLPAEPPPYEAAPCCQTGISPVPNAPAMMPSPMMSQAHVIAAPDAPLPVPLPAIGHPAMPMSQVSALYQDSLYPGFPCNEKGEHVPAPPYSYCKNGDDLPSDKCILRFFFNLGLKRAVVGGIDVGSPKLSSIAGAPDLPSTRTLAGNLDPPAGAALVALLVAEAGTATPQEQQVETADPQEQQAETEDPQEQQTDPPEQQAETAATPAMAVPVPPVATVPDTPGLAMVAVAILAVSEIGLAPPVVAVGCASPELLSAACARAAEGHQPSPLLALGSLAPDIAIIPIRSNVGTCPTSKTQQTGF
ncbi:UNVERIFIED_CONTAM: hypothetical protein FKN15_045436 [Acipenser sinensis]